MQILRAMVEDSPEVGLEGSGSTIGAQPDGTRLADLERTSCDLTPDGRSEHVYNEEAFRYFLELERKRSERSMRPFLLLLIDLRRQSASDLNVDSVTARKLFGALALCVRETDFIGWYHADRVAGAVLTQHADAAADVSEVVYRRLTTALNEGLPSQVVKRLQVRIFQIPTNPRDPS